MELQYQSHKKDEEIYKQLGEFHLGLINPYLYLN